MSNHPEILRGMRNLEMSVLLPRSPCYSYNSKFQTSRQRGSHVRHYKSTRQCVNVLQLNWRCLRNHNVLLVQKTPHSNSGEKKYIFIRKMYLRTTWPTTRTAKGIFVPYMHLRHRGGLKVYLHSKSPDREIPITFCRPVEEVVGGGPVR